MSNIIFTLQQKGGVGKSFLNQLLFLHEHKKGNQSLFIDTDISNNKGTLSLYINKMKKTKKTHIGIANFPLENNKGVFAVNELYKLIDHIQKNLHQYKYVFVDIGAEGSRKFKQFLNGLNNEAFDYFKKSNIFFYVLSAGGTIQDIAYEYYKDFNPKFYSQAILIRNHHFGEFKHKKIDKSFKSVYDLISYANYSVEIKDIIEYVMNNHLTNGEVKEYVRKTKGELYLCSKDFSFIGDFFNQVSVIKSRTQ